MNPSNRVVYAHPGGMGWSTVKLMASLLAELLDADLVDVREGARSYPARRALAPLPRRRNRARGHCIVVAAQPVHLAAVMSSRHVLGGFESVSGWVIDSFWEDRIPSIARGRGHFDHLFVTDQELVSTWQERTGTPTSWLGFGSDVLGTPSSAEVRSVDLLRVGRQPAAWDDDLATGVAAHDRGLAFAGRAPGFDDAQRNQASLLAAMRDSRFTLSFSNLVSPAVYTHPDRDYLTGRWTDALGSGCVVAGVPPSCGAARDLLWPEATTYVDPTDREAGLDQLAEALRAWTPDLAQFNRRQALVHLDWRWRFDELRRVLGVPAPRLDDAIDLLITRTRAS